MPTCTTALRIVITLMLGIAAVPSQAQSHRVAIQPGMLTNEAGFGDPSGLVDEQREIIGPPAGTPSRVWQVHARHNREFPVSAHLDLGEDTHVSSLWLFDTHNTGEVVISSGSPGQWEPVTTYDCGSYMKWVELRLDVTTRYLRITRKDPGALFAEIAIYAYTPEAHQAMQEKAEAARQREIARVEELARARKKALDRPLSEMAPYGTLSLVDEIDCAADRTTHRFRESQTGASTVEEILGRACRVLTKTRGAANSISYRIGENKLLRAGGVYVLAVEYPEDAPRSMIIINSGNETARGFHTGQTVGDAFHPKYVNNHNESIDVPLSGRWQTWTLLIRLHDKFPERGLRRGGEPRTLSPEDGFDVTIAQFSARNIPLSEGAAVGRIRLYEVIDPDQLTQPLRLPPEDLPRRHLFWREEMSDGVLADKSKQPDEWGVRKRLDWFRYKAELMKFLGMNTYTKDLLEFGACQHWNPSPHGGNDWVYHNGDTCHLWGEIVEMMGGYGFNLLPYYEYSGSKGGKNNLGFQRRAKPLTRDDAYTHISWIESANADLTDPATYEDFKKMLEVTVLNLRTRADFAGIWLRPRAQLPISFSDTALGRFAEDVQGGKRVTRAALQQDPMLYARYLEWWGGKRRAFLEAMRDYLRDNGLDDAVVLYTGCAGEPGVGFNTWEPRLVTDRPDTWEPVLAQAEHRTDKDATIQAITVDEVVRQNLYLQGLQSPGLSWGDWEVHHAHPADDPDSYRTVEGVLLTHAFNRNYTVSSPKTMQAYRAPSGLALVRHYSLNEHMLFDQNDQAFPGYFVADIERAGPYCMMAEALAMAHGDPTMIGYLAGSNYGRGFPEYVRSFNAHFLALPALPSEVLPKAASDPKVVVRQIRTDGHGTYLAVINTAMQDVQVSVSLSGPVHDAVTGRAMEVSSGRMSLQMHPMQLRSFHLP